MGQVTFAINGRSYRIGCADGEEQRLRELAREVAVRVDRLVMEFGQVGEARLLLMAALPASDELLDVRSNLDVMVAEAAERLHLAAEAARATALREAAVRETAPRETAPRETAPRETTPEVAAATVATAGQDNDPASIAAAVDEPACRVEAAAPAATSPAAAAASSNAPPDRPASSGRGSRPGRIELPGKVRSA